MASTRQVLAAADFLEPDKGQGVPDQDFGQALCRFEMTRLDLDA